MICIYNVSKSLCPFHSCSTWVCIMLSFCFLDFCFLHYGRDVLSINLQHMPFKTASSYLKIVHRVLALKRICLPWLEDVSILAGTLHLLEGKYYSSLRLKIPYVSSINLRRCDISYHCSTRMFLLGNALNTLMTMFIHQRKSFFPLCKMTKLFLI